MSVNFLLHAREQKGGHQHMLFIVINPHGYSQYYILGCSAVGW